MNQSYADGKSSEAMSQVDDEEELQSMPNLRRVPIKKDKRIRYRYGNNRLSNTKYSIFSFVPVVLFNQFKYFFNMFFLLIALSQFIE
mmetsp:Transcript_33346/g.24091  ORF Transcript_33346/g.24091 Transcript_33346/m.24091 type:complete len:87 (+) Transcript_33346:76-336(+)